jgi:hypothetical protein
MDLDTPTPATDVLKVREQLVLVLVELVRRVPDLENLYLVVAVGSVEAATLRFRTPEFGYHALVVLFRHLVWADMDGDSQPRLRSSSEQVPIRS